MRDPAQSRIAREKFRHAFFIITLGDLNAFNPLPQLNRRVVIVDGKFSRLNRSVHLATQILARDFEPAQTLLFSAAMNGALRILAVDNEPSVTLSMRYIFAGPQYEFTRAENGLEALATLDRQCDRFDVIIVDQRMPQLTGLELVAAIRERGIASKIIVVSAHVSSEVREAFHQMDVAVVFGKPFDTAALRAAVDRADA